MTTVHDLSARTIDGKEKKLSSFEGQALLIVNVASRCGSDRVELHQVPGRPRRQSGQTLRAECRTGFDRARRRGAAAGLVSINHAR
jgi:hypothetical protein